MGRIFLAFRVFFGVLFNGQTTQRVAAALRTEHVEPPAENQPAEKPVEKAAAQKAAETAHRHEALGLLAAMQREARLVDFLQEPIASYSDAQIGAAVRDIHRDCHKLLERVFALKPAIAGEEGAAIEVPSGFDAGRYRLTGNLSGQPPLHGVLCHPGWEATKCDLPTWTGGTNSARVIAPAEVELK